MGDGAAVKACEDACATWVESDAGQFGDDCAAKFHGVVGDECCAAINTVSTRHGEAAGTECEVRAGISCGPALRVHRAGVEVVGDEVCVAGVGCIGLAGEVEDGGGAVATEDFSPVDGGLHVAADSDIVGQLAHAGDVKACDLQRTVAVAQRMRYGAGLSHVQGSAQDPVGRIG